MAEQLARVTFRLESGAWHGRATERLWAEKIGSDRYRLRNSPFYVRGVSMGDVVFAEPDQEGQIVFAGVSLRGGHSTYRIFLSEPASSKAFGDRWAPLHTLGCTFEGVDGKLLSIDVPASADIYEVYALLEAGEQAGVWDFEEGHCGHPLKEKPTTTGST